MSFILENGKIFEMSSSEEMEKEIKVFIDANISKTAKITAYQNFLRNIINPLIDKFASEFEKLYEKATQRKEFKSKAIKILEISFDKLEQEIKEYNEKEKEKKIKKKETIPEPSENEERLNLKNELSNNDFNDIFDDFDNFSKQKDENLK